MFSAKTLSIVFFVPVTITETLLSSCVAAWATNPSLKFLVSILTLSTVFFFASPSVILAVNVLTPNSLTPLGFDTFIVTEVFCVKFETSSFTGTDKISFISQGAFGTGLHETTKDLLNIILTKIDLHNKKVLDIGTGSGILSIASAIIGASKVTALDIRDVRDEVELNSSLNGVYNIQTLVGDALNGEVKIEDKFDWIYINIGGEETELFMDFIKEHLLPDGKLLVSGLVEWSFDKVQAIIENHGFKLTDKYQSNEWITAIFN